MHWLRIIRRDDNPEWTAVRHADGAVSEVKVSIEDDRVHVTVDLAAGKRAVVRSADGRDGYELRDETG
jgi:hypothetical protein